MTALSEYERLEAIGVYTPPDGAQRQNAILSIGDASLVIADTRGSALAHWSLAAVERRNPGTRPALFAPATDTDEVVETDDEAMIRAIEKIHRAVRRDRPPARRTLVPLLLGGSAVLALAAVLWLPGAITRHAAAILPDAARQQLGMRLLDRIETLTGPACADPAGLAALSALTAALAPVGPASVRIMPSSVPGALALPGGIVLIDRALVETQDSPQIAAGYLLAAAQTAAQTDPALDVLAHAGLMATLRLMTTGHLPDAALSDWAEDRLTGRPPKPRRKALLRRFAAAAIPASPWARAELGIEAETVIRVDPVAPGDARPLLSDGEWVALQSICE